MRAKALLGVLGLVAWVGCGGGNSPTFTEQSVSPVSDNPGCVPYCGPRPRCGTPDGCGSYCTGDCTELNHTCVTENDVPHCVGKQPSP